MHPIIRPCFISVFRPNGYWPGYPVWRFQSSRISVASHDGCVLCRRGEKIFNYPKSESSPISLLFLHSISGGRTSVHAWIHSNPFLPIGIWFRYLFLKRDRKGHLYKEFINIFFFITELLTGIREKKVFFFQVSIQLSSVKKRSLICIEPNRWIRLHIVAGNCNLIFYVATSACCRL